ncbi:hypothetical protein FN846DRAFT_945361 [Sphaerosporella brunnea]|uniref:Zinc finger PHD-type domain-containing protein n=1 Tax=Sphaerosporella brunnea TaxID=1250544 RepID=A0A5J5F0C5_9PEZI|nr:hypothetical protein FN846DRAFT_945361 [Sphaerosporella brunnea]
MNDPPPVSPELAALRHLEEFASFGQFLFNFGTDILALPHDFGREELEAEIFTPNSEIMQRICLGLLKMVSSQRGLTFENFEEYTRRQYRSKKPYANPFGDEAEPIKFWDLDVPTRARILHQLSVWVFLHPERIRDKLKTTSDKEQLEWRMEPCGFDCHGNTYYILDDNRLYKRTPWVFESKKAKAAKRTGKATKRRRVSSEPPEDASDETKTPGGVWSCVCATLHDWTIFVNSIESSKDPDEKALCAYLKQDVMPVLNKVWVEMEKQRQLQAAVANRKRSSRLDEKMARQREDEERAAAERREAKEVAASLKDKQENERKDKEREQRMKLREQRMKEREIQKLQSSRATSATDDSSTSGTRRSSRRATVAAEKEEWAFDCICGVHGMNYEDGTNIIACDSCDVWQHLKCQNLPPGGEEKEFICDLCRKNSKQADGQPPSPSVIKLRVGPPSPEKTRASAPSLGASSAGITQSS